MIKLEEIDYQVLKPPTYFKINEFTYPFQEIVNTYGIPTYKEFNPTVFTCVTFPFLFGVMFGDVGHGSFLLLIGLILCLFQRVIYRFESIRPLLKVRYMVLLMGIFATYCGFIYNDFVSMPLNILKSCYDLRPLSQNLSVSNNTN